MIRRHIYETMYILYRMVLHVVGQGVSFIRAVVAILRPRPKRWSQREQK